VLYLTNGNNDANKNHMIKHRDSTVSTRDECMSRSMNSISVSNMVYQLIVGVNRFLGGNGKVPLFKIYTDNTNVDTF
jgi:hypothetical protein